MLEYMLGVMNISEGMRSQLKMPGKIAKYNKKNGVSIKSYADVLKMHKNPGYTNLINQCNDIEDLKYLRSNTNLLISNAKTIKERIEKCKKLGECTETKRYYKGIKEMYIDKGVTPKDCDLTIENCRDELKIISDKIKKLRKEEGDGYYARVH